MFYVRSEQSEVQPNGKGQPRTKCGEGKVQENQFNVEIPCSKLPWEKKDLPQSSLDKIETNCQALSLSHLQRSKPKMICKFINMSFIQRPHPLLKAEILEMTILTCLPLLPVSFHPPLTLSPLNGLRRQRDQYSIPLYTPSPFTFKWLLMGPSFGPPSEVSDT